MVALVGVLVIWYSLEHSIYRYIPRPTAQAHRPTFYLTSAPSQFLVAIALLLIKIAYAIASSFIWSINPFNANTNPAYLYVLGYSPALLILLLINLCGLCEVNEDKQLLIIRGESTARSKRRFKRKKPAWLQSGRLASFFSRDSAAADPDDQGVERFIEMGVIKPPLDEAKDDIAAQVTPRSSDRVVVFSDSGTADSIDYIEPVVGQMRAPETRGRNGLARTRSCESTTVGDEPPQVARSILDV